jgi:hypothetical protein
MDFGLKFEFARYLAVYRGIPRHTALPLPGGKNVAVGKKNPAGRGDLNGNRSRWRKWKILSTLLIL